jgi:hypothetical protein
MQVGRDKQQFTQLEDIDAELQRAEDKERKASCCAFVTAFVTRWARCAFATAFVTRWAAIETQLALN